MIELKLKRTALRWDFSFFAVLAVFFIWDYSGFGFAALGICTAHELAHLAVMRLCGMSPDSLTFYGAGIRLSASAVESAKSPYILRHPCLHLAPACYVSVQPASLHSATRATSRQ